MSNGIVSNSFPNQPAARPTILSYDSGYEHSIDRYVDTQVLLQEAAQAAKDEPATYAVFH